MKVLAKGDGLHLWEDNVKMIRKEAGQDSVDWIHLTQDRSQWGALLYMTTISVKNEELFNQLSDNRLLKMNLVYAVYQLASQLVPNSLFR